MSNLPPRDEILAYSRITSQNQISVPSAVRKHLGAAAGDELVWTLRGSQIIATASIPEEPDNDPDYLPQVVGVIGFNGSGQSALARTLAACTAKISHEEENRIGLIDCSPNRSSSLILQNSNTPFELRSDVKPGLSELLQPGASISKSALKKLIYQLAITPYQSNGFFLRKPITIDFLTYGKCDIPVLHQNMDHFVASFKKVLNSWSNLGGTTIFLDLPATLSNESELALHLCSDLILIVHEDYALPHVYRDIIANARSANTSVRIGMIVSKVGSYGYINENVAKWQRFAEHFTVPLLEMTPNSEIYSSSKYTLHDQDTDFSMLAYGPYVAAAGRAAFDQLGSDNAIYNNNVALSQVERIAGWVLRNRCNNSGAVDQFEQFFKTL